MLGRMHQASELIQLAGRSRECTEQWVANLFMHEPRALIAFVYLYLFMLPYALHRCQSCISLFTFTSSFTGQHFTLHNSHSYSGHRSFTYKVPSYLFFLCRYKIAPYSHSRPTNSPLFPRFQGNRSISDLYCLLVLHTQVQVKSSTKASGASSSSRLMSSGMIVCLHFG